MQNSSVSLLLVYFLTQQLKQLIMAVFDIKNNSKIKNSFVTLSAKYDIYLYVRRGLCQEISVESQTFCKV